MRMIVILLCVLLLAGCAAQTAQLPPVQPLPPRVTLYRKQAGEIVTLTCRDYIVGCLFAQVTEDMQGEALEAAATVMAGNMLCSLRSGSRSCGADLTDLDMPYMTEAEAAQEYGARYDYCLAKLRAAAEQGMRQILTCDGEPICVPFCAISSGRTEDGGKPWLQPVDVPWDKGCEDGRSSAAFSAETTGRTLMELTGVSVLPADAAEWFGDAEYTQGGTLERISFCGEAVTGEQLQQAFGLRSAAIAVEYAEAQFVFRVVGCGGNTGMSLHAASLMAQEGMTAEEILGYFYSGAELTGKG